MFEKFIQRTFFYRKNKEQEIENNNGYPKDRNMPFCLAPWSSMSFNIDGTVAVCCYNRKTAVSIDGKTIMEVWKGGKFEKLREHLEKNDLTYDCQTCLDKLNSGSYTNLKARDYDKFEKSDWPQTMEFCLDNTCNLACEMCNSTLSSTIRKNNGLPPLMTKYSPEFIEELNEFIPHLKEAVFVGGEPFLIDSYYEIWNNMSQLNPDINLSVVTNGTVLNNKVKKTLEKGKFSLNISIDSIKKEEYEKIRNNASFERLMENFNWFKDYCKRKETTLNIPICPMSINWKTIPDTVRFAIENDAYINFAYVDKPKSVSLIYKSPEFLSQLIDSYEAEQFEETNYLAKQNVYKFKNLIKDLKQWRETNSEKGEIDFKGFEMWEQAKLDEITEDRRDEFKIVLNKVIHFMYEYDTKNQIYIYSLIKNMSAERIYEMCHDKNDDELRGILKDVLGTSVKVKSKK